MKMLSVSSRHISQSTAGWLNEQGEKNATSHRTGEMADIHVGSHGYGWFVYCHDDGTDDYPEDLVKVINFAIKSGADYINVDSAGEEHSELEEYEW